MEAFSSFLQKGGRLMFGYYISGIAAGFVLLGICSNMMESTK